jgi:methionine synthase II (cobalamin-independent)
MELSHACVIYNDYVSLHIRSLYYKDRTQQQNLITNAVNCAVQLAKNVSISSSSLSNPSLSVFVASDSLNVTQKAAEYGVQNLNRVVVARIGQDSTIPLHLDRGSNFLMNHKSNVSSNWMDYPPSAYYDVFVDLYLLSRGKCISYNVGGFGYWASLISEHPSCRINHQLEICNQPLPI